MCLAGFGLAQLAENIVADHLREGLVEVLTDWQPPPVPVTLLYPHQRFSAVRAFAEWMRRWFEGSTFREPLQGAQGSCRNIWSADESLDIL
jgi:DNA-binding transcriptional LysR family regulator